MNLKEIKSFINSVAKSGTNEVKLGTDDLKIEIKSKNPDVKTQVRTIEMLDFDNKNSELIKEVELNTKTTEKSDLKKVIIKSPHIGTLSLKSPIRNTKMLKIGDYIEKGDFLCSIEALQLVNHVNSNISGNIKEILVEDKTPVEFDQPLFVINV
ncbi:acetyl-CoA carboxylase biotin carboxyl carrier protein [Aquimarina algicola]|uniref:Acetyl-CoA carboxylase, biotin carboxyl carrier protein n=1 Tax=Aquimarina algicola TaxID=2589995 RepID=A0A504JEN4_9FLAO|nr:biotin/lipoyl-containing protein [Aquimarina algicola]TPN89317.1 acetyl-CoA carboxylase, biotin carboxyl carrier protein [Aquimarina algicola]